MKQKNIILIVLVVIIIGVIILLEVKKPHVNPEDIHDIVVGQSTTTPGLATSTASSTPGFVSDRTKISIQKAEKYPRAKEFVDPSGFINTPDFNLGDIVGKKVVLLDFWTYSCINCQRTLPYLKAWYQKYKDFGFEIVGVHTPEFNFEKDYNNVATAVKQGGISYPVVLDNNKGTWTAYGNQYWPREYLIDIDGFIVHDKIGEGGYADSERQIQKALQERQVALGLKQTIPTTIVNPADVITMDENKVQSPEVYFGGARNEFLGNGVSGKAGSQTLKFPANMKQNTLYLDGTWNFTQEYAKSETAHAQIQFTYNAKNVYFVASSPQTVKVDVYIDGKFVNSVNVNGNKLYTLYNGTSYGVHTILLKIERGGLEAYTFTFG